MFDVRNFGRYHRVREQGVSNSNARVGVGIRVCSCNPKGMIEHGSAVTCSPLSFIKIISTARLRAHFLNSMRLFHYHTLHPGILPSINSRGFTNHGKIAFYQQRLMCFSMAYSSRNVINSRALENQ